MTPDEAFLYVYEKAKEYGDPYPEVVAAQWALESNYGKNMPAGTNNPFGQTTFTANGSKAFQGKKGKQYYWKKYDSIDAAIKDRVTRWGSKYKDATNAIQAMAMIQPSYAPSEHNNEKYMSSIANILKRNEMWDGDVNIPNADVDPDYYANKSAVADLTDVEKKGIFDTYMSELEAIENDDSLTDMMKRTKRNQLNRDYYEKGYITSDGDGQAGGIINEQIDLYNKKRQEELDKKIEEEAKAKKFKVEDERAIIGNRNQQQKNRHADFLLRKGQKDPLDIEEAINTEMYAINPMKFVAVDPKWAGQLKAKRDAQTSAGTGTGAGTTSGTETSGTTPTGTEDQETGEMQYDSDAWYNFMPEDTPVEVNYNPEDYQNPLPVGEMLLSAAGAIKGIKDAQAPIPERDEQVSDAFRQYGAELKMLSEMGLRPEEEAYAKAQLSEAYSQGVHNLTRMSGGNRNQMLANMGRLDAQNAMGKMSLAVEDARAKNQALFKYGEAMQYINEFDARRDIANSERDYQNAMLDKEAGANLANASLSNFLNEMQYWRENKPGSANHAYKSMMMKRLFGVDPMLKDDGTGKKKWTMSWREKENDRIAGDREKVDRNRKMWASFNEEQKAFIEDFNQQTGFEFDSDIIDFVGQNRNVGDFKPNYQMLPDISTDNFSDMFEKINASPWNFSKPLNIQ